MNDVTKSGVCSDEFGQLVLVTQGLGGYTLVANKKILFRLFLDVAATGPIVVLATITFKPFFSPPIRKNLIIPVGSLLIENTSPNGPSVGILFTGDVFPNPGVYEIEFFVFGSSLSTPHFKITKLVFLMPGRLRLLIHNQVGTAPWGTKIEPNFGWLIELVQSLERLSAMLPIQDGVKVGLTHKDAGLCWLLGENIDPWTCPSGPCTKEENIEKILREANEINSRGVSERVDASVSWRPRDLLKPGGAEGVGGQASYNASPGKGWVAFVGGNLLGIEFTAPILAQEIGHIFGLEPKESPHFEDPADTLHSKDRAVIDPFAFDFNLLKPYQPLPGSFIGDVMNNNAGGVKRGRDMVLYNAFDWEHLRKKFVQLPGVSRLLAAEKRPTKKEEVELVNDFHQRFADETEIKVANLGRALSTKEGFVWHWTPLGFQQVERAKDRKTRSGLAPIAEAIRSWLEDLGINEVYAPVGDHPLRMVINRDVSTSLHNHAFEAFEGAEGQEPHS